MTTRPSLGFQVTRSATEIALYNIAWHGALAGACVVGIAVIVVGVWP